MSLDAIFDAPEKVETPEAEAEDVQAEQPDTDEGQAPEPEKEEKPVKETTAPDAEEKAEEQNWTFHAVKEERRKRQELEKQLEEFKKSQQPKQDDTPSVFDDEAGFVKSIDQKYEQKLADATWKLSRSMVKGQYEDYDEIEKMVQDEAKKDPAFRQFLMSQGQSHDNPALFVYQQGKRYKQLKEMDDIDSVKQKLRSEIEAEVRAEFEKSGQLKAEKSANLKPSLAKERSADKNAPVKATLDGLFDR